MINFLTKLLTPFFITLGLISPTIDTDKIIQETSKEVIEIRKNQSIFFETDLENQKVVDSDQIEEVGVIKKDILVVNNDIQEKKIVKEKTKFEKLKEEINAEVQVITSRPGNKVNFSGFFEYIDTLESSINNEPNSLSEAESALQDAFTVNSIIEYTKLSDTEFNANYNNAKLDFEMVSEDKESNTKERRRGNLENFDNLKKLRLGVISVGEYIKKTKETSQEVSENINKNSTDLSIKNLKYFQEIARFDAQNAAIKAFVSLARSGLYIFHSNNGSYGSNGNCELSVVENTIESLLSQGLDDSDFGCIVNVDGQSYTFSASLLNSEELFCADSTGFAGQVSDIFEIGVNC
jgi:hypothetical protein